MVFPSGEQYEISAAGYVAVVTESGAALRSLTHHGRALVDGFAEDEMSGGGRGQLLMPWPNRIRDGRFSFGGREHQLALSDPGHGNASHGLARWASWTVEEHTATSVSLTYRVMAQSGYPWTLDLHVLYDLSADGLVVTQTTTNLAPEPAPCASGAHPYLAVGDAIEDLELRLPARTRLRGRRPAAADGRRARVRGPRLHHRTSHRRHRPRRRVRLARARGRRRATVTLVDPATGRGVALWVDEQHRWLQVFTPPSDGPRPGHRRRADDGPGRRVQLRHRPGDPGAGGLGRRRAVGVVGHPRPCSAG